MVWLRPLHRAAHTRLFCLPFAGGGAGSFLAWKPHMPPSVDLCPVLLPGREARLREPAIADMTALVAQLADALRPALDVPYALFGYSMGAWIAFELARELRRRGEPAPTQLLVASRRAPHTAGQSAIAHLPEPAFIQALQDRYNAIPAQILAERELMDLFLPTLRADLSLLESHQHTPAPPLPAPITAWFGTEDSTLAPADVAAWAEHTAADFTVHALPAGHFFQTDPRLIHGVARVIAAP